jgi:P-type Cu+ transporter
VPTDFFEGAAMLVSFILLGKWLEARASAATGAKLTSLCALAPDAACLVELDEKTGAILSEQTIDTRLVHIGDALAVKPGAQVPADGTLLQARFHHDNVNVHSVAACREAGRAGS